MFFFSLNNFCLIWLKEKQKMVPHWSTSVIPQENWWCNESSSLKEKKAKVLQVSQHSLSHRGEKVLSFQSNIVNITIYYVTLTFMIHFNKLFLLSDRKTQVCLIHVSLPKYTLHNIDWQLPFCVCLSGNDDYSNQNNTTCQSNLEEFANQQEKSKEDVANTDLQESVGDWNTHATIYHEL